MTAVPHLCATANDCLIYHAEVRVVRPVCDR